MVVEEINVKRRYQMIMNLILWILLGALAGWIASKIMNTDAQMGAVANIVVGIIGAFLGEIGRAHV